MVVAPKPMKTSQLIRRISTLIRPHWRLLLLMTASILGVALFTILPPYLLGLIIDQGIGRRDIQAIILLSVLAFAAYSLGDLLDFAQQYLSQHVGQKITDQLRMSLYEKFMQVPFSFYNRYSLGDIIARIVNDVGALQSTVTTTFVNTFAFVAILLCTLTFMFFFNTLLAFVAVAMLIVSVAVTRRVGKQGRSMSATTQSEGAKLMTYLNETLNIQGILTVKSFGQQHVAAQRFMQTNSGFSRIRLRMAIMNQWFLKCLYLVANLGNALVYLVGGLQILAGHASIGQIVASAALLGQLYRPANQLAITWVEFQKSLAVFERVFTVLDEPSEDANPTQQGNVVLSAPTGKVTFKDVTFRYPNGRAPALQEISFTIAPGEMVAIVGSSGAGKTTIAYLLTRIYEAASGTIAIDGTDIRSVSRQSLTRCIGTMTQDPFLFNLSVRENITFGCPEATPDAVVEAARVAAIHDAITRLPEGYDTVLGERGYLLSGGERQRIALARVILKNPRILILDEATSSLDSTAENLIQNALATLAHERAILVIAHRLSTIRAAHQILVLDKGRIVERGTHADLLRQGGIYRALYEHQANTATEREAAMQAAHEG